MLPPSPAMPVGCRVAEAGVPAAPGAGPCPVSSSFLKASTSIPFPAGEACSAEAGPPSFAACSMSSNVFWKGLGGGPRPVYCCVCGCGASTLSIEARASSGRGGASFWKGSSASPLMDGELTLLSSPSSRGGSGYLGYERSALADSGLEGGGLWTLTFLTGFFFWKEVVGGGASLFGSKVRDLAKSLPLGRCGGGWGLKGSSAAKAGARWLSACNTEDE